MFVRWFIQWTTDHVEGERLSEDGHSPVRLTRYLILGPYLDGPRRTHPNSNKGSSRGKTSVNEINENNKVFCLIWWAHKVPSFCRRYIFFVKSSQIKCRSSQTRLSVFRQWSLVSDESSNSGNTPLGTRGSPTPTFGDEDRRDSLEDGKRGGTDVLDT